MRELLGEWLEQEEKKVANTPAGSILFERKRGQLYIKAGYVQEGLDVLEDALQRANVEHNRKLYDSILGEINGIRGE